MLSPTYDFSLFHFLHGLCCVIYATSSEDIYVGFGSKVMNSRQIAAGGNGGNTGHFLSNLDPE